jgi:hypothetical protein
MTLVLSRESLIAAARDTFFVERAIKAVIGLGVEAIAAVNGVRAVIAVDLDKRPLHSRFDEGVSNAL